MKEYLWVSLELRIRISGWVKRKGLSPVSASFLPCSAVRPLREIFTAVRSSNGLCHFPVRCGKLLIKLTFPAVSLPRQDLHLLWLLQGLNERMNVKGVVLWLCWANISLWYFPDPLTSVFSHSQIIYTQGETLHTIGLGPVLALRLNVILSSFRPS